MLCRSASALALTLVSSCGSRTASTPVTPQNKVAPGVVDADFDTFERAWVAEGKRLADQARNEGRAIDDTDIPSSYRGIFIGHGGVIIDRTHISNVADIEANRGAIGAAVANNVKLAPTVGLSPSVVLDVDGERASVAIAALRAMAGHELIFSLRTGDPHRPTQTLCAGVVTRSDGTWPDGEEHVTLSVLLDADRTWVGLSRVNEFQEIPNRGAERDLDKLETTLKEHKASAFFADRNDAELAADERQPAADVISAFYLLCKVGFIDVAVLPREKLSAIPQL